MLIPAPGDWKEVLHGIPGRICGAREDPRKIGLEGMSRGHLIQNCLNCARKCYV